jgi:hypothetical protein
VTALFADIKGSTELMLANARRPSGRQGEMGPVPLSDRARRLLFDSLKQGITGPGRKTG